MLITFELEPLEKFFQSLGTRLEIHSPRRFDLCLKIPKKSLFDKVSILKLTPKFQKNLEISNKVSKKYLRNI